MYFAKVGSENIICRADASLGSPQEMGMPLWRIAFHSSEIAKVDERLGRSTVSGGVKERKIPLNSA